MSFRNQLAFLLTLCGISTGIYIMGIGNALIFDDVRLTDGSVFDVRQRILSFGSFPLLEKVLGDGLQWQRLFNIALHGSLSAILYFTTRELISRGRAAQVFQSGTTQGPSISAALQLGIAAFALNPVAVYAVAYLVQRSILMATLFVVLAIWAFVHGLATHRKSWFALASLFYGCAVMSKEHALMAAALVVPLFLFVSRPSLKQAAAVLVASIALVGLMAVLLFTVHGQILGVPFDTNSRAYAQQLEALTPGISNRLYPLSIMNQAALFFRYGFFWFVPVVQWMSIDMRPAFPLSFWAFPQLLGALAYVVLLIGSAWLVLRRSDVWGFVGLCLLIPAVLFMTEFATVWVQDPFVLYRSYLWAITIPGLIAVATMRFKPATIYSVGLVGGLLFAVLAVDRVRSLEDGRTVWTDAVKKIDLDAPANAVGRWRAFMNRGSHYMLQRSPELAYADFLQATKLGEPQGFAFYNMGVSLQFSNRHEEANAAFERARAQGLIDASLYQSQGESLAALRRPAEAIERFNQALALPQSASAKSATLLRRARAAVSMKQYTSGIADYNAVLAVTPGSAEALAGLALAYVGNGQVDLAFPLLNKAIAASPQAAMYHARAVAYVGLGNLAAARADIEQAVALDPKNPAHQNLRAMLAGAK